MANPLQQLRRRWAALDVLSDVGAGPEQLREFEARFGVRLPTDLRRYFELVNGMRSGQSDNRFLEFYPIQDVYQVRDLSAWHNYVGVMDSIPNADDYYVVGDFLASSHLYAVRLPRSLVSTHDVIALFRGDEYSQVANSWSEFLKLYLEDSDTRVTLELGRMWGRQRIATQGRIQGAVEVARNQVAAHPNSVAALVVLARVLQATGDFPGADQALDRAESLSPGDPWVISAREDQVPDSPEELSQGGASSAA